MFGLRWLTIYQYAFDRKGHEDMTDLFRQMKNEEYKRYSEFDCEIPINPIIIEKTTYPRLIHESNLRNQYDIDLLLKASDKKYIMIRGFEIKLR